MSQDQPDRTAQPQCKAIVAPREVRTIRSEDLFLTEKEIVIQHAGDSYRLRITKAGKLILYK